MRYDLIVIGQEPSGLLGALEAAKIHKKVALIDQRDVTCHGATCVGQSFSTKTLRDAALTLAGYRERSSTHKRAANRGEFTVPQLVQLAIREHHRETEFLRQQLVKSKVEWLSGQASFVGDHELEFRDGSPNSRRLIADKFLIAVGSRPNRPDWIPFDGCSIFDSDELLRLERLPATMIVVGAGVFGMEYALMLAVLGSQVVVIDGMPRLLEFCDQELVQLLRSQAESMGVRFRLGKTVTSIERREPKGVTVKLADESRLLAESVLYAANRIGNTDQLELPVVGLMPDECGRLWCNEHYQTWVKHIYGVGDVVGFPPLAGHSINPGVRAVQHAFGLETSPVQAMPYGLYTIPELAMIGPTEERLSENRVPYEVGMAQFRELVRGDNGMLKLLFHRESKQLLGVHCLGNSAIDLIQLGQTVMSFDGRIDAFHSAVVEHSTSANFYRQAALDGLRQIQEQDRSSVVLRADTGETSLTRRGPIAQPNLSSCGRVKGGKRSASSAARLKSTGRRS